MKKMFILLLAALFSSGCISLFSEIEINESGNQHHNHSTHSEDLERRINELEEKIHYLLEVLEEREFDSEKHEDDDED